MNNHYVPDLHTRDTIKKFKNTIITMYGKEGQRWLDTLPSIIRYLADKWHLKDIQPMAHLSYNFVATATYNNIPVILKIGFDANAIMQETAALRALAGPCVQVYEYDDTHNAILLEAVIPGTTLKKYFPKHDKEAVTITSELIKSFKHNHVTQASFTTVAHMLDILNKNYAALDNHLDYARALRTSLLATATHNILLHGDLHHDNILRHNTT